MKRTLSSIFVGSESISRESHGTLKKRDRHIRDDEERHIEISRYVVLLRLRIFCREGGKRIGEPLHAWIGAGDLGLLLHRQGRLGYKLRHGW